MQNQTMLTDPSRQVDRANAFKIALAYVNGLSQRKTRSGGVTFTKSRQERRKLARELSTKQ